MEQKTITPVALTLLVTISITFSERANVVNTTLGPVQGLRKTVLGRTVDVYYGIPFAKPPVGELRFKRPEPADPWTEVRPAVTKPNACMQTIDTAFNRFPGVEMWNPNTPMSEDCLYLNVWVPRFESQTPITTMVWIYGGSFSAGSSVLDVYDGSKLAVSKNVIVASINYRVGPLGFLYTGTLDCPGNQGLLDQSLALKWIHDNVVNFGGRQDSITIVGESAGAMSVGLHLLSPVSRDHFTRAIMESSAPMTDMIVMPQEKAKQRAMALAESLHCNSSDVLKMVQCLRQLGAENVTNAQWGLEIPGLFLDMPTTPVVDDYMLKDNPWTLLAQGEVKDTELLLGSNKDEGIYFLLYRYPELFPLDNSGHIDDKQFKHLVHLLNGKGEEVLDEAVMYEYVDRVIPANRQSYRDIADDISGDVTFICPVVEFANAFSRLNGSRDVYMYSFEHRLSNNPWPEWTGVMHGYEIEAVFGLPLQHNYTQQEQDLSNRMMNYWTRFARTGNPNGDDITWPQLTSYKAEYLRLSGEGDSVRQGRRNQQCSFRATILPLLQQEPVKKPADCS